MHYCIEFYHAILSYYITLHCIALRYIALNYIKIHDTALHCINYISLRDSVLHNISPYHTTLNYHIIFVSLHYVLSHFNVCHYIAMYAIMTLHYITYHYTVLNYSFLYFYSGIKIFSPTLLFGIYSLPNVQKHHCIKLFVKKQSRGPDFYVALRCPYFWSLFVILVRKPWLFDDFFFCEVSPIGTPGLRPTSPLPYFSMMVLLQI